jgi:hypothetical protein
MRFIAGFFFLAALSVLSFFLAFNKRARKWSMKHRIWWGLMSDEEKEAAEALHIGGFMVSGIVFIGIAAVLLAMAISS